MTKPRATIILYTTGTICLAKREIYVKMAKNNVRPFKIAVPDESLDLLRSKLELATFPVEVDFSDVNKYGASRSEVKRLAEYWKNGFDWRTQEARLNNMPQYTTAVKVDGFDDLNIHFIHQRGKSPDSIPLLFCHGCKSSSPQQSTPEPFLIVVAGPGSFLEVTKILPLLTNPKDGPSFHVVAPSLPNFGFSDRVKEEGFSICHYAQAAHKVMLNLGYDKYGKCRISDILAAFTNIRDRSDPRW